MGPDHRAVEDELFEIRIPQLNHDLCPVAFLRPTIEAFPHGVPRSKPRGQITPRSTGSSNPQHGVKKETVVLGGYPRLSGLSRQKMPDAFPLIVLDRMPMHR
jgi:hypothetical protein